MSRLRANQITNENANGAPNFPHGITVTGIVTASTASTTMDQIVVGSAVTANSQGIDVTGIVTATSFSGSGANLTSLPAANLTGALPAISGANLTGVSAGKVLNYVSAADNTEYGINTGTTYTAIHGSLLQLAITPSATSSRILIMFNWGAISSYQASCLGFGKIMYSVAGGSYQNVTPVGQTNTGQGGNTHFAINLEQSDHAVMGGLCYSMIHHPNTTSALIYRPYFKTEGSGGHIYINRSPRNASNDISGVSWAYALELAG